MLCAARQYYFSSFISFRLCSSAPTDLPTHPLQCNQPRGMAPLKEASEACQQAAEPFILASVFACICGKT